MANLGMHRFFGKEGEYVPLEELMDWVYADDHRLADGRAIPILIWGAMGIGKTAQIKAYCEARGLECREYHPAHDVNGGDIVGLPQVDEETNRLRYAIPGFLPVESDPPGVLFIDEINRAPELVLAGLMEPIGGGTISQSNWKIPDHWMIVAAANPREEGYQVNEIDEAMVDRFLHYAPGWDAPAWAQWASRSGEVHADVVNFALRYPDMVSSGEPQLPHELQEKLRATPRSMSYVGAVYEPGMNEGLLRVISEGLLGRSAAIKFREHVADTQNGIVPLEFEEVLTGKYSKIMQHWIDTGNDSLLHATSSRVIAALVNRPVNAKEVGRLGMWLAKLPNQSRTKAFDDIARSCPEWMTSLQQSTEFWIAKLARDGRLLGPGRPRRQV
jgi:hypothetical protein